MRRPITLTLTVVALWLLAVVAVCTGVLVTMVSNCCGSPDPADPTGTTTGVLVGLAYATAAVALGARSLRTTVAAVTAPAVGTVALSVRYPDLAGAALGLVVVAALVALAVRRPAWRAWAEA